MTTLEDVVRLLPDYELANEVGRGEYGVVWRARHRQLGRGRRGETARGPGGRRLEPRPRFRREAQILAALDHPHVVRVFDYRESGHARLLIMELLTGGTLTDRRRLGLSLPPAISAIMAAASGLHHVHERGVLHRDVKPENLMFDANGILKVTDFGIARGDETQAAALNVTRAGEFFGTPAYIAPEQAAPSLGGGWPPVGPAADQYSLAAVLYELLSGALTHDDSGGWIALCSARMNQEAVPLRSRVPELAPALEAVVSRALRRDPAERYGSVEEFGVELGRAMTSVMGPDWYLESDVAIREPGPIRDAAGARSTVSHMPTPRSAPRRISGGRLAVISLLTATAAAAATWFVIRDSGPSNPPPATVSAGSLPLRLASKWSAPTAGNVFASPAVADGVAVVGSEDGYLYGLSTATGSPKWRVPVKGGVRSSAAIVGATAYVGGLDGAADPVSGNPEVKQVYAFDVATGNEQWAARLAYQVVSSPVVAGGLVVIGADGLYAFDAATGDRRWQTPMGGTVVSSPAVSGDAVVVGSNDGNVYIVTLADGVARHVVPIGAAVESSPRVADGVAYVGSVNGSLYAIDVASGSIRWQRDLGSPIKSSPTVADERVVVGTDDGRLISVDRRSGKPRWTFAALRSIDSSPLWFKGLVVVGSNDGNVYAVDGATGALRGRFETRGPVLSSPRAAGDAVIVGSQDDRVYAIVGFGR